MNEFMKFEVFSRGEPPRPVGISHVPGEEPRMARSTTLVDDGCKPECVRIGRCGVRLSKKRKSKNSNMEHTINGIRKN